MVTEHTRTVVDPAPVATAHPDPAGARPAATAPGPDVGGRSIEAEVGDLLIRLLATVKNHFLHSLAEIDLTPAQGFALHQLEEPMPMRRLADELGYDASYITGIVDHLEGRGLVERRTDPHDRRVKLLVTTAKGRALRHRIQDHVFDRQPIFERLSATQRRQLRDLLRVAVGERGEAER